MAAPTGPGNNTAAHLEAIGATEVTFEFRGAPVTIPLAIEDWPCDAIRQGRSGQVLKALLGAQRPAMKTQDDVTELSHRMADAVGVSPLPESLPAEYPMFGAVPRLLEWIDTYPDDIAADLRRFHGVDYADRWRGEPRLTLRQIWVYIRRADRTSALALALNGGVEPYGLTNHQLADIWSTWNVTKDGKQRARYPGRPMTQAEIKVALERHAANTQHAHRDAERQAYYASGQNMRDAGVSTDGLRFPAAEAPPPKRPPRKPYDPVEAALQVAKRNAQRSMRGQRNGNHNSDARPRRYDPAGSGWG